MEHEHFIDTVLNDYDSKMEETYFSAKSSIQLETYHNQLKFDILKELPQKWRNTQGSVNDVPDTVRQRLNQKLDSTFEKLKRHFEKSKQREQTKVSAATAGKDAISYYNDEMEKYYLNHQSASPKEIEMQHAKFSIATMALARKKLGKEVNSQLLLKLREEMEARRKVYHERAVMILQSNKDPAVGIDLGTTMCCVMVFYQGKIELIPNRSQGNARTTPSYVAFHEGNTDTFGYVAKEEAYKHPEITVYDAKRMIGRPFLDEKIQNDIGKWPFEVVNNNGNVKVKTGDKMRYPHEVSARLLARFRLMAESHLKVPRGSIKKAVITVPAYFTEPQRRATNEAAICAGLHVLNILSEPTAAAIAYSWERRDTGPRRAVIYDLGGGTFDVAVAMVTNNSVDILCVDGDTHLGGQDFDQLLMDYCIHEFKIKEGIDLQSQKDSHVKILRDETRRAMSRIKLQCEKAKERLTTSDVTTVQIEKLYGSKDLCVTVTKIIMENLVRPLVQKTINIIDRALAEAKYKGIPSKNDVEDVILVGGSTRMPLVTEMVTNYFNGKQLCTHINPDEAVAYGAAIQAAILNKNDHVKNITVQDVIPVSLGLEVLDQKFSIHIPKNSEIPCVFDHIYVTAVDNQIIARISIFQGEEFLITGNKLLGEFRIGGIPPKPAGEEKVKVTMTIDEMGILNVDAESMTTGQSESITISADRMGMDKRTINQLTRECQQITIF